MFTLLRRIRKSLITSGSSQRYLLYALGEVALVVIGILIALQVSKWNEQMIDRHDEEQILQHLHEEFLLNKVKLINVLPFHAVFQTK